MQETTCLYSQPPSSQPTPPDQPLLGWCSGGSGGQRPIGFAPHIQDSATNDFKVLPDTGEGHLLTFAPTGAGKGRGVIIPTLLSYTGPVVVIDPKGENYAVTARRRREMGQKVILFDPFGVTGDRSASFNPLDLIETGKDQELDQARSLAQLLCPPSPMLNDPFWEERARQVITALILFCRLYRPPVLRNLGEVCYLVNQSHEDFNFTLKEMMKLSNPQLHSMVSGFSGTESKVHASIMSTAQTLLGFLQSAPAQDCLQWSDFDPEAVVRGDPLSIYLVLPPAKLASHGALLRLWVGMLMELISRRRYRVQQATLFILDEAAQLGPLEQLRQAITLMRGYGLRTWSFWQDLSQLKRLYPDWQTLYNNAQTIQTFGITTAHLARELTELFCPPSGLDLLQLPADKVLTAQAGKPPRLLQKMDYLHDAPFAGLFDINPFYQPPDECLRPEPPGRENCVGAKPVPAQSRKRRPRRMRGERECF